VPDWARHYFDRGYPQRWGLKPPTDQIRRDAADIATRLGLAPRSRLLDIGCGHGKYALAIAALGVNVTGLDFASGLLRRASDLAGELGVSAAWVRGDIRRLPFRSGCIDAAILADAFGFFATDAEDETVLHEAGRVVRVGGRLAIKVVNGAFVLGDFHATERQERDGTTTDVVNTLSDDPPRLFQRLHISGPDGAGDYERHQRLYRADEICEALETAGVHVEGVFADPQGTAFDPQGTPGAWIFGVKVR